MDFWFYLTFGAFFDNFFKWMVDSSVFFAYQRYENLFFREVNKMYLARLWEWFQGEETFSGVKETFYFWAVELIKPRYGDFWAYYLKIFYSHIYFWFLCFRWQDWCLSVFLQLYIYCYKLRFFLLICLNFFKYYFYLCFHIFFFWTICFLFIFYRFFLKGFLF